MLVARTDLQLKGAFAENLEGQTPLDLCHGQEPFYSELHKLVAEHTCILAWDPNRGRLVLPLLR